MSAMFHFQSFFSKTEFFIFSTLCTQIKHLAILSNACCHFCVISFKSRSKDNPDYNLSWNVGHLNFSPFLVGDSLNLVSHWRWYWYDLSRHSKNLRPLQTLVENCQEWKFEWKIIQLQNNTNKAAFFRGTI